MNDSEARGAVLRKIYDLKDFGRFVDLDQLCDLPFDRVAMDRFLGQLSELGLINRKPLREGPRLVADMIKISPHGVELVEKPEGAPPRPALSIQNSEIHVGGYHVQNIRVGVGNVQVPATRSQVSTQHGRSVLQMILEAVRSWF